MTLSIRIGSVVVVAIVVVVVVVVVVGAAVVVVGASVVTTGAAVVVVERSKAIASGIVVTETLEAIPAPATVAATTAACEEIVAKRDPARATPAIVADQPRTAFRSSSPRRMKAATTSGSNWVPAADMSSSRASVIVEGFL